MFIDPTIKVISCYDKSKLGDLPDSFDSRLKWPNWIHPIRDQGQWGSWWAHATTKSLSDRLWIQNIIDVILSPQ